ncbi:threonine dehydratase [Nocardia sp. GP40]|uniref:pyridoxal-phosphate dependent enzyme n=1 Tax=Nocardia sp. GP40 TaxID=3156268 RepID=UPI003D1F388B
MTDGIGWHPHVVDAWNGIASVIRPLYHSDLASLTPSSTIGCRVVLARELDQWTGSYRARGAVWYLRSRRKTVGLPGEGIAVVAYTESAATAWCWAAQQVGVRARLFVPPFPDGVLEALRGHRVTVQAVAVGDAITECAAYADTVGALQVDPTDQMIAAGAGTWVRCINSLVRGLDTVIIAAEDDALVTGTVAAANYHRIKTVLATAHGTPIPAAVQQLSSITEPTAFPGVISNGRPIHVESVTVEASDIDQAAGLLRRCGYRVSIEGAMPLAALMASAEDPGRGYRPQQGETVALLLAAAPADAPGTDAKEGSR